MPKPIEDIIYRLKSERKQLGVTLYAPASEAEILDFESKLNLKLPEDIRAFYQFCNGFESDEYLFRIIPLDEIVSGIQEYKPYQFHIAEYLVYSDVWTIRVDPLNDKEYGICNYDEFIERICLTTSFAEFLDCFLNCGIFKADGLYDWHERAKLRGA